MDSSTKALLLSAGFGAVTGIRSMAGLAFLSRSLARIPSSAARRNALGRLVTSRTATASFAVLSAGEMVADKLPMLPDRTEPGPLAGRAVFGGAAGYLVSRHCGRSVAMGVVAGALSAVGAASLFTDLRHRASESVVVPAWLAAVLEDVLVLSAGAQLLKGLDARS